jgi:AcrR family transcriptional regulator
MTTAHEPKSETASNHRNLNPPKRRSRELTTKKLLEAGLEVFSKYGYDAATTKLVAKRAGINESLINRYFDGKAGLLHRLILDFAERSLKRATEYPKGETVEQEIRNLLHDRLTYYLDNLELVRLATSRALIDCQLNRELEKYFGTKAEEHLVKRLEERQSPNLANHLQKVKCIADTVRLQTYGIIFYCAIDPNFDESICRNTIDQIAIQLSRYFHEGSS